MTVEERIIKFLRHNRGTYTPKEIASALDINYDSVNSISESPKQPRYLTLTVSLLRKKTLRWTYYWETPAVLPA